MPLYVNDAEVDALAKELQQLTKARTKKAAVREALINEINRNKRAIPLRERIAGVKARVRNIGLPNPAFNQKRFSDDMWGE